MSKKRKDTAENEALRWVADAPPEVIRFIGEMPTRESIAYIKKMYKLGATEIFVIDIDANGKYESASRLSASLPSDRNKRAAIFDAETDRVEEMGFEMESDTGQETIFLWFD